MSSRASLEEQLLYQTANHLFFKGRVALHAILKAAGIGPGDQVLLPGYTCVVVPNAINYTGAEPVYLDIEPATYNLDPRGLAADSPSHGDPNRIRAIIVQHTYGIPCPMDQVRDFASRHNLLIIEDACHTLGSTWKGQAVGTMGDAAFFSSQWSKPVTTGLGGWAQINNEDLDQALMMILDQYHRPGLGTAILLEIQYMAFSLLNHPRLFWSLQRLYRTLGRLGLAISSSTGDELACELPEDYQRTMHPFQQRRLRRLLRRAQQSVADRKCNTAVIEEALTAAGIPTVPTTPDQDVVFLRYPVPVQHKSHALREAQSRRIKLGDWFLSPIHPNLEKWELAGYRPGSCPVAEWASRHVVNIPTDPGISSRELRRSVAFLREFEPIQRENVPG